MQSDWQMAFWSVPTNSYNPWSNKNDANLESILSLNHFPIKESNSKVLIILIFVTNWQYIYTGCLNMICQTSNQHFFRSKLHSKQKPFIFGILGRGDLCIDNQFLGSLPCTAFTASYLKYSIFLMILWRKACIMFQAKMTSVQLEWPIPFHSMVIASFWVHPLSLKRVTKFVDSTIATGEAALWKAKRFVVLASHAKPSGRPSPDLPVDKPARLHNTLKPQGSLKPSITLDEAWH